MKKQSVAMYSRTFEKKKKGNEGNEDNLSLTENLCHVQVVYYIQKKLHLNDLFHDSNSKYNITIKLSRL